MGRLRLSLWPELASRRTSLRRPVASWRPLPQNLWIGCRGFGGVEQRELECSKSNLCTSLLQIPVRPTPLHTPHKEQRAALNLQDKVVPDDRQLSRGNVRSQLHRWVSRELSDIGKLDARVDTLTPDRIQSHIHIWHVNIPLDLQRGHPVPFAQRQGCRTSRPHGWVSARGVTEVRFQHNSTGRSLVGFINSKFPVITHKVNGLPVSWSLWAPECGTAGFAGAVVAMAAQDSKETPNSH